MTVSSVYEPVQYTGNGVTTAFSFPYIFYDDTDITVTLTLISTGANTVQTNPTNYTITGGDGAAGTINFVAAPSALYRVTIERDIPYTQEDNYVEGQAFPAQTIETAFDRGVIRDQQINSSVTRSLKFPATLSTSLDGILPTPVDDAILAWDGTSGTVKNGPSATDLDSAATTATAAAATATSAASTASTAASTATAAAATATAAAAAVSLPTLGAANTVLQVNAAGNALEYEKVRSDNISVNGNINMNFAYKLENLSNPFNAQDAVTKSYADALVIDATGRISDGIITYVKLASSAIGSAADIIAGTASKIVTAANLIADTNFAQNGHIVLQGGLIVNWGKYTGGANNPTITFSKSYASTVWSVVAIASMAASTNPSVLTTNTEGTTSFKCDQRERAGGATATSSFFWIAIGK